MGKRSNFKRLEKDKYMTIDARAYPGIEYLLKLYGEKTFSEPCCGQSHIVDSLEGLGFECVYASDIDYGDDALEGVFPGDCIVTNPPWTRDILHKMILYFSDQKPTYLLFDAGWMFTKQAKSLMKDRLTDIMPVGRLKWIPGTTMSGKDDCAWYRFTRPDLKDPPWWTATRNPEGIQFHVGN